MEKREQKLELKRKKLRNSEMLQSLTEEFTDNPENFSSTGVAMDTTVQKELKAEEDERRDFEEDRFIRLVSQSYNNLFALHYVLLPF